MTTYNWLVKYNKEKFKFTFDGPPPMQELKARLFSLTDVSPDRQKLMVRGKILTTDEDLKKQKLKAKFFLYGTNEVLAAPPKEKITFIEDMTEAERALNKVSLPCGLENLGNTCYLNSTVQAIRACKDFKTDMKNWVKNTPAQQSELLGMSPDGLARTFGSTLAQMDMREEPFVPNRFVGTLRREFPRFAETSTKTGGYIQHDADEFLVELLNKINQHVTCTDNRGNYVGKIVDHYFTGEYLTTQSCDESKDETQTVKEPFLKLQCFVDKSINYLGDGIESRLVEKIEKNSMQLGRNAVWTQERRIAKLPPLLIVQIMRFFWKANINKSCKIKRKVAFPKRLDVQNFCAPVLKDKIIEYRQLKEKEVERRLAVKDKALQDEADKIAAEAKRKGMAMDIDEKGTDLKENVENVDVEVVEHGFGVKIKRGAGPVFIVRKGSKVRVKNESSDWVVSKIHADGPTVDLVKGERKKNTIPENLSPTDYDEKKSSDDDEIKLSKPTGYYRIVGLVTHKGQSASSGHYIGYAREPAVKADGPRKARPARWLKFDDEYTMEVDDAHMQQLYGGTGDMQMGYICIYKECDVWEEDEERG